MKSFDKLKKKLAELFQLDQADLDFGLYRIINARRNEITRFLENDLLSQVQESFKEYRSADKAEIQKEIDQVIAGVRAAGMDPEQSPKVKELRSRLATDTVDITALKNEVYDNLYSFFSRYYDEGDFISLRRYKEGVYAIPYEGEEVKLYWANHDQYYVKTTEYFRDYAFKTPDDSRIHFKIIEADTEKDNVKAANGKDRRFFLHGDNPVVEENGELVIRFEYRPDEDKRKQDQINNETVSRIIEDLQTASLTKWERSLKVKWKRSDGTISDKTILEKHLYDYTRRNTFDYFIHKDLGGFLRRELDFYIKNEVMRLDDVENETARRVEQYLSKIKVIRKIAHKLIDFLAQIEDFQKKLWLKKKFVIETNYCVTLDRVPEELYPEIAANNNQREEWVHLFAIDEIKGDMITPAYSVPLTIEFLKSNKHLILDTRFFSTRFIEGFLSQINGVDEKTNGFIFHSENFQGLQFITPTYLGTVGCIFIDPPYNTGSDGFPYKDAYQHSSWLSMMQSRLLVAKYLLSEEGSILTTIDDTEQPVLLLLLRESWGDNQFVANIVWEKTYISNQTAQFFSNTHDHILCFCANKARFEVGKVERTQQQINQFKNPDNDPRGPWKAENLSAGKFYSAGQFEILGPTGLTFSPPAGRYWRCNREQYDEWLNEGRIYFGRDGKGRPMLKKYLSEVGDGLTPSTWWEYEESGSNKEATIELKNLGPGFENFVAPKPAKLIKRILALVGSQQTMAADFFAGSGTTAHAIINLNREDGGGRRYILIEVARYFDTVLIPRIKKVVYAKNWKDGKPVSRNTGISQMFKYIRLESYEDTLANIEMKRMPAQQNLLEKSASFRESYLLRYMLDAEAKGSASLLNVDQFDDPFNYQILVGTGSVGETKPVFVDLVETFNWLLGLKVRHIDFIQNFRIVEGTNPKGERVLIIWRKVRDLSETDPKKMATARAESNRVLEAFFRKQQYNTLDREFDVIYVNGDNNLMNLPLAPEGGEPRYKVRLIEEEFKRLMFDVKDV